MERDSGVAVIIVARLMYCCTRTAATVPPLSSTYGDWWQTRCTKIAAKITPNIELLTTNLVTSQKQRGLWSLVATISNRVWPNLDSPATDVIVRLRG